MNKVEIFTSNSPDKLENEINDFFLKNPDVSPMYVNQTQSTLKPTDNTGLVFEGLPFITISIFYFIPQPKTES